MSGRPSAQTVEAMKLIVAGTMTPADAARTVGIALSTIYRSTLYKQWKQNKDMATESPQDDDGTDL